MFTEVVRVHEGRKGDEEKVLRSGMVVPGLVRDLVAAVQKAAEVPADAKP